MIDLRAAALIAVCAGVTMLLRFLPFLVFGGKKEVPGYITYLSGVLPYVSGPGGILNDRILLVG